MYELQIEQGAERDLKNLKKSSQEEFQRVVSRISALSTIPRPAGARKIVGSKNDWRLRIGTYFSGEALPRSVPLALCWGIYNHFLLGGEHV